MIKYSWLINLVCILGLIFLAWAGTGQGSTVTVLPAPEIQKYDHWANRGGPRAETEFKNKTGQFECIKWAASKGKDGADVHNKNWTCLRHAGQAF